VIECGVWRLDEFVGQCFDGVWLTCVWWVF
jgi:hypothetical protein